MPIKVTVKRFAGRPLDPRKMERALRIAQEDFAIEVSRFYLETMETFSNEHGTPMAYPIQTEQTRTSSVFNIYPRGDWGQIYRYLDFGFTRKVVLTFPYESKTRAGIIGATSGSGGIVRTSRGYPVLLDKPVDVKPRYFTRTIAEIIRGGHTTYAEHMARFFHAYMRRERGK